MYSRVKKISVFLVVFLVFGILVPLVSPQVSLAAAGYDQDFVTLVNQARVKSGLPALSYDGELSIQATNNLNYYLKSGKTPDAALLKQIAIKGGYSRIGQIFISSRDVKSMFDKELAYYGSSFILNPKYNRIGLVVIKTTTGILSAQLLATKENEQAQPEPAPQPSAPQEPQPVPQPEPQPVPQQSFFLNDMQQKVVDLVNQERAKYGLKPLVAKQDLTSVAQLKAQDMYQNKYFNHTSPTYGSPFDMLRYFGINYTAAGENLALGQKTPVQVVQDWMNSPGHRANILNPNYTEIGVGIYNSYTRYGYIWVQMFARR